MSKLPRLSVSRRAVVAIALPLLMALAGCVTAPEGTPGNPEVAGRFYRDPSQSALQTSLEEATIREMERQGIPALSLALRGDRENIAFAFGTPSPDRHGPIDLDAQFRVGSVTKLFTATIILSLWEEGRLSLDQTVSAWYPELEKGSLLTIRHLLTHRSGLTEYTDDLIPLLRTMTAGGREWDRRRLVERITRRGVRFTPGSRYEYSNSNYYLLGDIAEKVSGKRFEELLAERITAPLELSDTYLPPPAADSLLAGYDYDLLPLRNRRIDPANRAWPSFAFSAGGIVSTGGDLATFLLALFEGKLLAPDTVVAMTDYLPAEDPLLPEQVGYGLGIRAVRIDGKLLLGHTGSIPGFGSFLFYWPDQRVAIGAAANRSSFEQLDLLATLVREISEQYLSE